MSWNFPFVINGGGISSMRRGSKESMEKLIPATTTKGRIFLVTTPGEELIYLDNGSRWVPLNNMDNTEVFEKINDIHTGFSLLQNAFHKEVERAGNEEQSLAMKLYVLTTEINTLTTEANIIPGLRSGLKSLKAILNTFNLSANMGISQVDPVTNTLVKWDRKQFLLMAHGYLPMELNSCQ